MTNDPIQPNYGVRGCSAPAKAPEAPRAGAQGSSFWALVSQGSRGKADTPAANTSDFWGLASLPTGLRMHFSVQTAGRTSTKRMEAAEAGQALTEHAEAAQASAEHVEAAEAAQAPSLENMLKAKYPGIHYHVFDASSGYWKTRNDYPHYLLYQDGDEAKETLENWKPMGANPFYGSIDGRFTAPKEIHALGSVPPGSKAVVIHPKVQQRMAQDPAYAEAIYAKIDTWFAFDMARNEAILPGSTWDLSQAVAIGEDGNICNACSSSAGGEITYSKSGCDETESWWRLRTARHAAFMKRAVETQRERQLQASALLAAGAAKAQLAAMLNGGNLREIFGSEIAGVPTEAALAIAQSQVWGGKVI